MIDRLACLSNALLVASQLQGKRRFQEQHRVEVRAEPFPPVLMLLNQAHWTRP
jgi:hypothetical protein